MHSGSSNRPDIDEVREHVIHIQERHEYKSPKHEKYEARPNRYSLFGWNRNSQQCYNKADLQLLAIIKHEFEAEFGVEKSDKYFNIATLSKWQGLWSCTTPQFLENESSDSFTLATRPVKDANSNPLWQFADNKARAIANWQSDRVKGQKIELHNDPSMLAFKILRQVFYEELIQLEAKEESITYLTKLQNFVKNLVYKIPDFGPDRSHFHEVQNEIVSGINIIENAITNKELPRLLSDLLTSSQSLERMIAMHLHYLVDQRVTDNFSSEYLYSKKCQSVNSPVCKLFQNEESSSEFKDINRFYDYATNIDTHGRTQVVANLKMDMLKDIRFNDHIDKRQYLELAATLDSLMSIRKTIEDLQSIQEDVGKYNFAIKFTEASKALSINYISLVNKAQGLINNLMRSADKAKSSILHNKQQTAFANNLRLLETRATKNAKVAQYLRDATDSMHKYQKAMQHLVADMQTGEASIELENAIKRVSDRFTKLNQLLPALIHNLEVNIENTEELFATCPVDKSQEAEKNKKFSGFWDDKDIDPINKKEIFTYHLYEDDTKKKLLGTISFYGMPALCVDEAHKQNNIYKTTGIFDGIKNEIDNISIKKICEVLPPSTFDRIFYCTKNGMFTAGFTGIVSNMIAYGFKACKASEEKIALAKHISYYGCIFVINFYNFYQHASLLERTVDTLSLLLDSVCETGKSVLIGTVIYAVKDLLNHCINKGFINQNNCTNNYWFNMLLPYLTKLPGFVLHGCKSGFFEASITTGATIFTEKSIDYVGKHLQDIGRKSQTATI